MPNAVDIFPIGQYIRDLAMLHNAPQGQHEPNFVYGLRSAVTSPFAELNDAAGAVGQDAAKGIQYGLSTPASRASTQPGSVTVRLPQARTADHEPFPKSYMDPVYDDADAYASKLTGVPQQLIRSVRVNGERSNADQVSSAGARTPYQIIPSTAAGVRKKYGIDPMSSPRNAALAAAYVLREQAGNPGPGQWTLGLAEKAVGGYLGGHAGSTNPFGASTRDYVMRTIGGTGKSQLPFAGISPFDSHYADTAMGDIADAQRAANTPFTASFSGEPMPQEPMPEPSPKTDFSQSDADLQAMKPTEVSDQEIRAAQWKGFFSGLGHALSATRDGEGIGSFFGRLGGDILQGKAAAMGEVQKMKDDYNSKLAAWQAAVYAHDTGKAQIAQQELLRDWTAKNAVVQNNYQAALQVWKSNSSPQLVGNDIVSTRIDPATGKQTVNVLPIRSAVDAAYAMKRADLHSQMFSAEQGANSQVTGIANQITGQIAMAQAAHDLTPLASTTDNEKDAAATVAPAMYSTFAVEGGLVPQVIGQDQAEKLYDETRKQLTSQGIVPGTQGYQEAFNKQVAVQLATAALADPTGGTMKRLTAIGPAANLFNNYDLYNSRRQQIKTSTGKNGQTQTTETTTYGAN